jgi:hypothetical protein
MYAGLCTDNDVLLHRKLEKYIYTVIKPSHDHFRSTDIIYDDTLYFIHRYINF